MREKKWVTNMYKSESIICSPEEMGFRRGYLFDKIIGKPKASFKYTVEELEDMGMIGVYIEEDVTDE